jgi:hypothetical protein
VPRKQRHTAKRVFDRLRDECGFTGGYTIIKDYMRERDQRRQEVFVPLSHPPGHAQADFGEAMVVIGGVEQKAHFFVLDLPHSDACYVRAYPAAVAEAWVDGHIHAFAFFGAVPQSIVYDNDRCLVAKILPDGTRKRAALFSGFLSHYLIRDRYGRPGKGQRQGECRGPGRLCPAQLHGADPAVCDMGCVQRLAGGAVPQAPARQAARRERDDRRTAAARSGGHAPLPASPFDACDQASAG